MRVTENWVDVSHSIGVPFGAIGTGFGIFGKYGFVHPNFNSFPFQGKYKKPEELGSYDYLDIHGDDRNNFMSLVLTVNDKEYHVQKETFEAVATADVFESHEFFINGCYCCFSVPGFHSERHIIFLFFQLY